MGNTATVTSLLHKWRGGEASALDELMPLVYDELRRLARKTMAGERREHTLQATALVHEACVALLKTDVEWRDRAHFMALAARLMRRILVDHARSRSRAKRGAGATRVTLEDASAAYRPDYDMLDIDRALARLSELDERKEQIIELRYFGGLTSEETAEALGLSPATVYRDLKMAKAWLYNELQPPSEPRV